MLFFIVPDGATPWVLGANLVTFYSLFVRAIAVPDRILPWLPSYLSIEVLFLAFSYLIFYYQYQLFLLGATDLSVSVYFSNSFVDGSNKAITLATVGMLAFTMGYRVLGQATRDVGADGDQSTSERNKHKNTSPQYFHAMATASSALLLALVALYLLAGWRSANEGRYTGTTTEGLGVEGTFMLILMFCMIVAALWVYATAAELRKPPMLAVGLVVAIAWSVRMLVLRGPHFVHAHRVGARGRLLHFRTPRPACGVGRRIRHLDVRLQDYRSDPVYSELVRSENFWELMPHRRPISSHPAESSFNITTVGLRATVEMVPDTYDFMYGFFKLFQFSAIIPFSAKLYLPYMNPEYTTSQEMLRDIMISPGSTWDPGTNVISDPYIDFGVPGVVVILFAIGLFGEGDS